MSHDFGGFRNRFALMSEAAQNKNVVHLGAIGLTYEEVESRVAGISSSLHARLTSVARECVGVDIAADVVEVVRSRGIFDNIVSADATHLARSDIPIERIDLVIAGDLIEHLSNPGVLLDGIHGWTDPHTELIVTTPNSVGLPNFLRYSVGKAIDGEDHLLSFNVYTLQRLLQRHGWQVDQVLGCYQPTAESSATFKVARRLLEHWPHLAGTLFVRASKSLTSLPNP